jgi:hypothetical protein
MKKSFVGEKPHFADGGVLKGMQSYALLVKHFEESGDPGHCLRVLAPDRAAAAGQDEYSSESNSVVSQADAKLIYLKEWFMKDPENSDRITAMLDEINSRIHTDEVFTKLGLDQDSEFPKDEEVTVNYDCMRMVNNLTQTYCDINSEYALAYQKAIYHFCGTASETEHHNMEL